MEWEAAVVEVWVEVAAAGWAEAVAAAEVEWAEWDAAREDIASARTAGCEPPTDRESPVIKRPARTVEHLWQGSKWHPTSTFFCR